MSKAEEKAQAAYPAWRNGIDDAFNSSSAYCGFIKGYNQAEKDLELTWEDICEIMEIREDVLEMDSYENLYQEILKRFKAMKEIKD